MRSRALRLAALGALALGCLLLASCREQHDDGRVITFWAMGREAESVAKLLPEFERRHPDIRVRLQMLPWKGAHAKLLTAFASDSLPDLLQLGNTWVPELVSLDALMPLDDRVKSSQTVDQSDYFAGIWDTNVIQDTLYGVPWYVDTRLLFYRRDLLSRAGFDAPPRTWEEWLRQQAAIKQRGGPEDFAVLMPLNEFEPLLVLALQHDEPLLRDGMRYGNFRTDAFRETLSFYNTMFQRKFAPAITDAQVSNVWNEFGRGVYAFYISGPWNIAEFKKRLPPELQSAWMTAPMPGPTGPGASSAGGSSLVIARNARDADAAWMLIEYLSEPDVQRKFHGLIGDMPPRRSSWEGSSLADDPYARAFREQLEIAKPTPKIPEWEQIADQLKVVGERLAHGEVDVAGAAEELDARADRILEKRRWMLDRHPDANLDTGEAAR
jgi:multiple sugar transport system substrate-binding protein